MANGILLSEIIIFTYSAKTLCTIEIISLEVWSQPASLTSLVLYVYALSQQHHLCCYFCIALKRVLYELHVVVKLVD